MRLFSLILATFLVACDGPKDTGDTSAPADIDGDGWTSDQGDCNDGDATVYPEADEVWYDGVDQNCDGLSDYDQDADGSEQGEDCDDANPAVSPTATETCNEIDDDCDGEVDEEGDVEAFVDADGDGYGTGDSVGTYCELPSGTAANADDCNDAQANVSPAAEEVCDEVDNNCDGEIDVGAVDGTMVYTDADQDGFGDAGTGTAMCGTVEGTVADSTDCDDTDSATYPGAVELCDLKDNDCDGAVDDDATEPRTYYADADTDGYGDPTVSLESCGAPAGYVEDNTDCDDTNAGLSPGADEVCDGVDSNCNGLVDDEPVDGTAFYADTDGDSYGSTTAVLLCDATSGYVADNTDCDDATSSVNPGAAEVCDGADNNCDGSTDDATSTDAVTWYVDADTDGFGDTSAGAASCEQPAGFVADDTDCNDTVSTVNPAADEVCDTIDNDCDGTVDAGALDAETWYADADGDGFGDISTTTAECDQPVGYVVDFSDCDDTSDASYPGAIETCDGADQDCDGAIDNDPADGITLYADSDDDGYGGITDTIGCEEGSGWVANTDDCDDSDADINPGGIEVCDGVDNNCDTFTDGADAADAVVWYDDGDSDGYGDATDATLACDAPVGSIADDSDCNDASAATNPGAPETCDSADNDCNGTVDDNATDADTWYRDADTDTYGTPSLTRDACTQPSGYVSNDDDCNDASAAASPVDTEACDSIDNDCDGAVDEAGATGESTWYVDADGDDHGLPDTTTDACDQPAGYASVDDDCDDADDTSYPGAVELDDVVDNDCDGFVDEDFIIEGDIILTEIDRQPRVGSTSTTTNAEWFEVYNTTTTDIDMSEWYVRRYSSTVAEDGFYVDPVDAVVVPAGGYATFCKTDNYTMDSTSYSTMPGCDYYWGNESASSSYSSTYEDNTFNMQRDADSLSFYISGDDATGTLIDTVAWTYDATNGYWPRDATRSTQLSTDAYDSVSNDDIDSWCSVTNNVYFQWYYVSSSNREYGTPATANHLCP